MSAQPDSFAGFIDVVASSLDEPARADELAARLHVSRSQLDRVVNAAAGEAPGRLRRRILLERAAFLLEGKRGILDVAIEAGYASHEAFTRAFRRDYGVAPSEWRTSPGAMHLPAPNRVHFHPPGGLRLPARREVTSMDLVVTMTEHHIWLVGQMIDRRVPPGRCSTRQADRDLGREPSYDFAVENGEDVDSMRSRLADCGLLFLGHVRGAAERGGLDDMFVDTTTGTPWFFTYGGMVAHVLTYAAHRRTLVSGALHTAGMTDLEDDPLAWEPVRPDGPTLP